MKKDEIKEGVLVVDRWFTEYGTGVVCNVKKTVFTVDFGGNVGKMKYDYPHAQFLDKVEPV